MEIKVSKKLLSVSARHRCLTEARLHAANFIKSVNSALDGTSANLYMDFGESERNAQECIASYLSDVEQFLNQGIES